MGFQKLFAAMLINTWSDGLLCLEQCESLPRVDFFEMRQRDCPGVQNVYLMTVAHSTRNTQKLNERSGVSEKEKHEIASEHAHR